MLRPYQIDLKREIYAAWNAGARNVLAVSPTGSGKTVVLSEIIADNNAPTVAIAHRHELISQMSLALARNKIRHRVVGSTSTQSTCRALHLSELQRSFIDPHSRVAVASVDTLIRRDAKEPWFKEVTLWVVDECTHLTKANKWGKAIALFPNARGLGVTATPCRADGKGLGAHADGVMHKMTLGPTMRELITAGYLTEYRIYAPPSDIDLSQVTISASGDYSPPKLAKAVHQSRIVGDVVKQYTRLAAGKLGITFAVDIASATEIAAAYRAAGVPAEVVSANTPDLLRNNLMRRFRNRELLQIVNVDLFGEGYDLPALEVVSMARPTQSYGLYIQQFGRAMRLMEGKSHALILDHVGNVLRHGLPDASREWTLDRRERRSRDAPPDVIPVRVCPTCLSAYESVRVACPYCNAKPVPVSRSAPDQVDGDLAEMSPELLARLRGEITAVDAAPKIPYGAAPVIVASIHKRHRERVKALEELKNTAAVWGGWRTAEGDSVPEQQRRFFHTFGIDVLSMQALPRVGAEELSGRIRSILSAKGVDASVIAE